MDADKTIEEAIKAKQAGDKTRAEYLLFTVLRADRGQDALVRVTAADDRQVAAPGAAEAFQATGGTQVLALPGGLLFENMVMVVDKTWWGGLLRVECGVRSLTCTRKPPHLLFPQNWIHYRQI